MNNGYQIIGPISKALNAFKKAESNEMNDKSSIIDISLHNKNKKHSFSNDVHVKIGDIEIKINNRR